MESQVQPSWREEAAEIWNMFKGTDALLKRHILAVESMFAETDRKFQETDRKFQETDRKLHALFAETDRKFQETDRRLHALFAETDRKFQETDKRIKELSSLFGDRWGKLVEALAAPSTVRLFQERGIGVRYVYQRIKAHNDGRTMEVDVLLEDEDEVVVVEVKSNLKVGDVNDFLRAMEHFLEFFPRYRGYRIYGGVAGLVMSPETGRYAYRRGLFVLTAVGEGTAQILNDEGFRPRDFGVE